MFPRQLESEIRSKTGKMNRQLAGFGALTLPADLEARSTATYEEAKGRLLEDIELFRNELSALKA